MFVIRSPHAPLTTSDRDRHNLMSQGCDDAKSKHETTAATASAIDKQTGEAPVAHPRRAGVL